MKKAMIAVAALAASGTAFAGAHESGGGNGPDWTYVDVGYWVGSSLGKNAETDGFDISGSIGFAETWHARAVYKDGEIRGGQSTFGSDVDGYAVFIGGHPELSATTDLVFEIGYFDEDIDTLDSDSEPFAGESDGYIINAGIRSMIFDNAELNATVSAVDFDANNLDGRSIRGQIGGQYYATDNLGIGATFTISDVEFEADNTARFYVRYNF
jgi:hypothetical protein